MYRGFFGSPNPFFWLLQLIIAIDFKDWYLGWRMWDADEQLVESSIGFFVVANIYIFIGCILISGQEFFREFQTDSEYDWQSTENDKEKVVQLQIN